MPGLSPPLVMTAILFSMEKSPFVYGK